LTDGPRESPDSPRAPGAALRNIAGWCVAVAVLLYAGVIHNGVGIPPNDNASAWWHATGFLLETETVEGWTVRENDEGRRLYWTPGVVYFTLPALVATIAVFALTGSAIARTLACAALVSVPMFAFYGLTGAIRIWEFFHWRASAVFVATGLALGGVLASPVLARSWLRQKTGVKLALYLPLFAVIVSLVRHATGTDEKLLFNFSPWPAVPVLGLEIGAYTLIGLIWGVGLALGSVAIKDRAPVLAALGLVVGLLMPSAWFAGRFGTGELSPLVVLLAIAGLCLMLASVSRSSNRQRTLAMRAVACLVGATLAFAPMATGRALATGDYVVNKFVKSQIVIDALARYYEESEEGYPDELETLVDQGYLDAIPTPRLGFDFYYSSLLPESLRLDRFEFFYQSLGSSYVLEFTSTEWVQCAYNPPWADEDEYMEDAEDEDEYDDEEGDAWSCPNQRPELW
jgi:hypothetical protein